MKLNASKLLLAAALFACLAGCAASTAVSTAASTAASQAAAAKTIAPLDTFTVTDLMADGTYAVSFAAGDIEDTEGGYKLNVVLWSYDQYDMAEANALQPGDTILVHKDGADKAQEVAITSLSSADGVITINGGAEEGGLYLKAEDTVYRTLQMDDYPMYYEIGKTTLSLSPDIVLSDASADFGAEPVLTNGGQAVAEAIADGDDYWFAGNTSVRIEDGEAVELVRIWVP